MNLVLLYCLLLFIIYLGIVGLLVYYFFRARDLWNIFIDEIYKIFQNIVNECNIHNTFGLFIPRFIYSNTIINSGCIECARNNEIQNTNLYNVKILYSIYNLFKTIDAKILEDVEISSKFIMFQRLLEYIIRNYKELCNTDFKLYETLKLAYNNDILSSKKYYNKKDKQKGLEIIPILEEYYNILEKCYTICQNINIEMIHCIFIIAFYQDIKLFVSDARKYLFTLLE